MRILLVEDDELLRKALSECLAGEHYAIDAVADAKTAWEYLSVFSYDLVVLDVLLPGQDGIRFCQELRSRGYSLPVLLLSARDTSINKIEGLDAGADDFVTKPFDIDELAARIRALLRRGRPESSPILQWGQLSLDPSQAVVTYGGQPITLTPKEYALLELFLRNRQRVLSFNKIMDSLWPAGEYPGKDTVRSHIKDLRQRLQAVGAPYDTIATVRGRGYRLKLPAPTVNPQADALGTPKPQTARKAEYLAARAEVWEQYQSRFAERLNVLSEACSRLKRHGLDREFQQRAAREAHTLAGTLGTFGLAEGSRLARELESILLGIDSPDTVQVTLLDALATALRYEIEVSPSERAAWLERGQSPLVLIAGCNAGMAQQLAEQAAAVGLRTAIASTSAEIRQAIAQEIPSAAFIDLSLLRDAEAEAADSIAALAQQTPPVPVIAIGESDRLSDRIEATRLGASTFLKTPVTPEQAFEVLTQALSRSHAGAKVMVVDDDPQLLQRLTTLLEPWGFKLSLLDDPRQFWQVLEAVKPDLVVLDVAMPHVSGIELCQVLRGDPDWNRLPVLFLTARSDAEIRRKVFAVGADDHVNKPVVAAELANRILNRLSRGQN
ncbi:response regulator [Synechococcus sp. PCC 7336]|uniref:response regulator n=1 Tax=Synechococcus sp. PCC 7336 TaxID=195250 RepID=UPI0003495961|nr:response regulator [Synechococcus sp. PCC 7336]